MKKIFLVSAAILALGLSLTACGGKENTAADTNVTEASTSAEKATDSVKGSEGDANGIQFDFQIEDFNIDGMDIWTDDVVKQLWKKYDMVPTEPHKDQYKKTVIYDDEYVFSKRFDSKLINEYQIGGPEPNNGNSCTIIISTMNNHISFSESNDSNAQFPSSKYGEYKAPFYSGASFDSYYPHLAGAEKLINELKNKGESECYLPFKSNLGEGNLYFEINNDEEDSREIYTFIFDAQSQINLEFDVNLESGIVQDITLWRFDAKIKKMMENGVGEPVETSAEEDAAASIEITDPADGIILGLGSEQYKLPISYREFSKGNDRIDAYDKDLRPDNEHFTLTMNLIHNNHIWDDVLVLLDNDPSRADAIEDTLFVTGFQTTYSKVMGNVTHDPTLVNEVFDISLNGLVLGQEITDEQIMELESFGFVNNETMGWGSMLNIKDAVEYTYSEGSCLVSVAISDNFISGLSVMNY